MRLINKYPILRYSLKVDHGFTTDKIKIAHNIIDI